MKISIAQISSRDDKAANLEMVRVDVERAAADGSDLIVFPEFTMFNQSIPDARLVEAAEPLDGGFPTALAELARRWGVALVAGVLESIPGEARASNTLVAYSNTGESIGVYRKVHLYNAFGAKESDIIRPSDELSGVTFPIADMTVGLHTCYDLRFPESSRQLAIAGADLLLLPASWAPGPRKEMHWKVLSQARAIENTAYFAAVGQAPPIAAGGSLLVDPMGTIVGELGELPSMATYEVSPDRVAAVRVKNPALTDRRFTVTRRQPADVRSLR